MDGIVFFAVLLAVVAFAIVSTMLTSRYERKRTEAWRAVAQRPGMQFVGENSGVLGRFGQFKMFQKGRAQAVSNAIAVDSGEIRIVVGDFCYTTGSGKSKTTHKLTICALQSALLHLPHCCLRPESRLFDALGALFGGQDIDFQEDSEFSAAFVLQGEQEAAIRQAFTAPVRAWFAQQASQRLFFEAQEDKLVFHRGKRVPPDESPELMDQALQILHLLAGGASAPAR